MSIIFAIVSPLLLLASSGCLPKWSIVLLAGAFVAVISGLVVYKYKKSSQKSPKVGIMQQKSFQGK